MFCEGSVAEVDDGLFASELRCGCVVCELRWCVVVCLIVLSR